VQFGRCRWKVQVEGAGGGAGRGAGGGQQLQGKKRAYRGWAAWAGWVCMAKTISTYSSYVPQLVSWKKERNNDSQVISALLMGMKTIW